MASASTSLTISPPVGEVPHDFYSNVNLARTTFAWHWKLLTTNEPPPEGPEVAFVRSVISNTDARLTHLDEEISRLRIRLKELEEEHASLASYHAQNNSILSPLRRMPSEVLAEIFSWTLSAEPLSGDRSAVEDSPWVLTQVSHRWRVLSLSTPALWSLVVIDYSYTSEYSLSMVKTQIHRARLLKIHFFGKQKEDSRPQIEMFRFLAEHSSRWEELCVQLTSDLLPLLASLRGCIPSLRRFWLQWDGSDSSLPAHSIDCFQMAPCLVDVGSSNQYRHVPILLPAHQLTRCDLDGPWGMHRDMLKLAPHLLEARITTGFSDEPWPVPEEAIELLCLECLYVSDTEILEHLKAPALTELAFYLRRGQDPIHLHPFVARSGCTLRRLSVKGSPTAYISTDVLPKHPSITQLAIIVHSADNSDLSTVYNMANTLISHLTIPDPMASAAISPQLSEIYFGCDGIRIDHALYLKMLRSHWKPNNGALERAALLTDSGSGPDPVTLSGLHELRQDGLDLLLLEGEEATIVMGDWLFIPRWN